MESAKTERRSFGLRAVRNLFANSKARAGQPLQTGGSRDDQLFAAVLETGRKFHITVAMLLLIVAWAFFAWVTQLWSGLGVTGLNRPVYWGFYITNFVFFIGISHAGTLISAILRLCKAEWRRSITRSAEVITVLVLFFGVGNVLMDLGRPGSINMPRPAGLTRVGGLSCTQFFRLVGPAANGNNGDWIAPLP